MSPNERVLGDFLGVTGIAQQREGQPEDFFALVGPDFQESGFIAGVETTDAFGVAGGGGGALGAGSFGGAAGGGYAQARNRGGGGVVIHGIFCFKGRDAAVLPRNMPSER